MLKKLILFLLLASCSVASTNQQSTTVLSLSVVSSGVVHLMWTASTTPGVTSYEIYRSTTSGGYYGLIGSSATTTYTDSPGAGTFYYVATAIDPNGASAYSNQATAVVP